MTKKPNCVQKPDFSVDFVVSKNCLNPGELILLRAYGKLVKKRPMTWNTICTTPLSDPGTHLLNE